jgi:hypothetical protein
MLIIKAKPNLRQKVPHVRFLSPQFHVFLEQATKVIFLHKIASVRLESEFFQSRFNSVVVEQLHRQVEVVRGGVANASAMFLPFIRPKALAIPVIGLPVLIQVDPSFRWKPIDPDILTMLRVLCIHPIWPKPVDRELLSIILRLALFKHSNTRRP